MLPSFSATVRFFIQKKRCINHQCNRETYSTYSSEALFVHLHLDSLGSKQGWGLSFPAPCSSQQGWKLLGFRSSFPWSACWGRRNRWGKSRKLQLRPLFWERESKKLSEAAVIRLKDEHKSMWGEHSGRINCWEGVSRGGCENFCNMKRLYLQLL